MTASTRVPGQETPGQESVVPSAPTPGEPAPLAGRVAIVTGAGKPTGMGAAVAARLRELGADVAALDVQLPGALPPGVRGYACDVMDRDAVARTVERVAEELGPPTIVINCAGMDRLSPHTWDMADDDWRRVVGVNLDGAWWVTSAAVPHMQDAGFGRVVFISSNAARIGGFGVGHSPAYSAAKAALGGLAVALSSQLEADGIRVNTICSGPTGTTGTPPSAEERAAYEAEHPLGFGTARPLVDAVEYLCRSSGDWISGAVMNVSGGEFRGF